MLCTSVSTLILGCDLWVFGSSDFKYHQSIYTSVLNAQAHDVTIMCFSSFADSPAQWASVHCRNCQSNCELQCIANENDNIVACMILSRVYN